MRIAAGIFLILVFIINLIAGGGYALGGAVTEAVGEGASDSAKKAADVTAQKSADDAKATGRTLKYFGFGLWLVAVLQMVAAVQLFRAKGKGLVLAVGGLTLAAEVGGILLTGFGILNIPGLI